MQNHIKEKPDQITGVTIDIGNIEDFIDTIYINPMAPEWFMNLIKDLLNQYHINVPLLYSSLKSDQLY